jgi:hypothetical protein
VLSPEQEKVICDWCEQQALLARPYNPNDLRALVYRLTGAVPGLNWHYRFEARHPELTRSRPSNLDPKRAENFNEKNINHYFDLVQELKTDYPNLPPEHMWNMDEKGIQLGGGRKNLGQKYYRMRSLKRSSFYRVQSDNLELVTIMECISAAGEAMPPTFVLAEGPLPDARDIDEFGGYVHLSALLSNAL